MHRTSSARARRCALPALTLLTALSSIDCRSATSLLPPAEVRVEVAAPGLSSTEVEAQIAVALERALGGAPGLMRMRSRSTGGSAELRLHFAQGADRATAALNTRERLRTAQESFGPSIPMPSIAAATGPVIYRYTVESPQRSGAELWALHEELVVHALRQLPGVGDVSGCGGGPRRVEVIADPRRLAGLGIPLSDLTAVIGAGSARSVSSGMLQIRSAFGSLSELQALVIAERNGAPVRLSDVAVIQVAATTPECLAARDDQPAVLAGEVRLLDGSEATKVQDAVRARLAQVSATLPARVTIRGFGARKMPEAPSLLMRIAGRSSAAPGALRLRIGMPARAQALQLSAALRPLAARPASVESVLSRITGGRSGALGPGSPAQLELLLLLRPGLSVRSLAPLAEELLAAIAQQPDAPREVDLVAEDTLGQPLPGALGTIALRVRGPDRAQLATLATAAREALAGLPAVKALRVEGTSLQPQLALRIDRQALARLGVPTSEVLLAVEAAGDGKSACAMQEGASHLDVVVRFPPPADAAALLADVQISVKGQGAIPLSALVTATQEAAPTDILRDDGQRCVLLRVAAPALESARLMQLARDPIQALRLPPGVVVSFEADPDEGTP